MTMATTTSIKRSRGYTLVEMMIAATIGLIVTAAVVGIYLSNIRSSTATVRTTNLNQELRAAMEIMLTDIRRAGFWGNAANTNCSSTTANPFMTQDGTIASTDVRISNSAGAAANSCVTYSFDRNGLLDAACTDPASGCCTDDFEVGTEAFGFRLNSGAVQIRTGGTTAGNFGCDNGNWESLTDPAMVTIDTLTFRALGATGQPSSQCFNTSRMFDDAPITWQSLCSDTGATGYRAPVSGDLLVETRVVEVNLAGHLTQDTSVRAQLREFIKVRNDRNVRAP